MLLAYLCSLDEGIKKHRPEALKSMKIKLQGLQNPFQKQLKSDTASEEAFEPQLFRNLWFFNEFWLPKRTQNRRKNVENAMRKNNTFLNQFLLEFSSLWLPKMEKKLLFFGSLSKKLISWKPLFFHMGIAIFLVLSFRTWTKFRCKIFFENYIGKNGSKIEFGHRFWSPKTTKIAPKSDAKRSLFRDAMEITPESSEINGPHSIWITNRATHMIRSSLLICPSSP